MISNMSMFLFWLYLVWFGIHVVGFPLDILHVLKLFLIFFSSFDPFLVQDFFVFKVWFILSFNFSFGLVFWSNQCLWFGLWSDQWFHVNLIGLKFGQRLRLYLTDNIFAKGFFFNKKSVFGKHLICLFWQFWFKKIKFLPNLALKKKCFLLVVYDQILIKIAFYLYKKREKWFLPLFLENFYAFFFGIYNKFIKFLKNLINISITLKL
jgi:hypothetical protein